MHSAQKSSLHPMGKAIDIDSWHQRKLAHSIAIIHLCWLIEWPKYYYRIFIVICGQLGKILFSPSSLLRSHLWYYAFNQHHRNSRQLIITRSNYCVLSVNAHINNDTHDELSKYSLMSQLGSKAFLSKPCRSYFFQCQWHKESINFAWNEETCTST